MPRKVQTGPAQPVALGYQDGDQWVPLGIGTSGTDDTGLTVQMLTENISCRTGTAALAADQAIFAPPGAGYRIVVTAFCIQNASATATTFVLHAETDIGNGWRVLGQSQGDGLAMSFANGREWRLPEGEGLYLWLSGANTHNYSAMGYAEAV